MGLGAQWRPFLTSGNSDDLRVLAMQGRKSNSDWLTSKIWTDLLLQPESQLWHWSQRAPRSDAQLDKWGALTPSSLPCSLCLALSTPRDLDRGSLSRRKPWGRYRRNAKRKKRLLFIFSMSKYVFENLMTEIVKDEDFCKSRGFLRGRHFRIKKANPWRRGGAVGDRVCVLTMCRRGRVVPGLVKKQL